MADTSPKILQAPSSPLWYHVTVCGVLGLVLALVFALARFLYRRQIFLRI